MTIYLRWMRFVLTLAGPVFCATWYPVEAIFSYGFSEYLVFVRIGCDAVVVCRALLEMDGTPLRKRRVGNVIIRNVWNRPKWETGTSCAKEFAR